MTARRSRADVQPITWEIPAAGAASWLSLAMVLFPAGQGAAGWLSGGSFVWPRGSAGLMQSIGGLLGGRPGRGLPAAEAAQLPAAAWIYLLIGLGEVLLTAATVWLVVLWWRHFGPGVQHGMADRAEVESVLGLANLRRKRKVIRPDLHGADATTLSGRT